MKILNNNEISIDSKLFLWEKGVIVVQILIEQENTTSDELKMIKLWTEQIIWSSHELSRSCDNFRVIQWLIKMTLKDHEKNYHK